MSYVGLTELNQAPSICPGLFDVYEQVYEMRKTDRDAMILILISNAT